MRNEVVTRFLEVLQDRIGSDFASIKDLRTGTAFGGMIGPKNGIWAFRKAWSRADGAIPMISLRHESDGNGWFVDVGVDSEAGNTDSENSLKKRLRESLGDCPALRGTTNSRTWPWYRYLEQQVDWGPLLARLHREAQEPGELAAYFDR